MKNLLRFGLQVLFVTCAATLATGQIRTVEKSEYEKIYEISSSSRKLNGTVTVEYKKYGGGEIISETKTVTMTESPGRTSFVRFETREGKTIRAFESIEYDKRRFIRTNEGRWREIITRSGGGGFGSGGGSGTEPKKLEQYSIGSLTLDNKKATLYSLYLVYELGNSLTFTDNRKYVDDSGRLIKEEFVFSQIYPSNVINSTVTTYDYDTKNLRIEIPKDFDSEEK